MINKLSGYSLTIYNNGNITEKYFGYREIKPKKLKTTKDTFYDIASLTKTYTSVLVFTAYEEGLLSVDDYITDYEKKFVNLNQIKIKDLLCHNQEILTDGYIGDSKNYEEYLKILFSSYVASTKPNYVDIDYIILGYILEIIYKDSLDDIITRKIIKKLDLKNTTFNPTGEIASTKYEKSDEDNFEVGEPHDKKARNLKKIGITTGHASIFATSKDLLLFLEAILNNKILKKETIDIMIDHHDINKLNKNNNWECKTYNYMGSRYYNDILCINDVPSKGNIVSFSGYTGPRYLIDFDKKIIIVLMCNLVHKTKLDRKQRFDLTKNIIFEIYNELI